MENYSLYRFYNNDDVLLYIGVSFNAIHRFLDHRTKTSWFHEISKVLIEKHETKEKALEAESDAIAKEKPLYNKLLPRKKVAVARKRNDSWIVRIKKRKRFTKGKQ